MYPVTEINAKQKTLWETQVLHAHPCLQPESLSTSVGGEHHIWSHPSVHTPAVLADQTFYTGADPERWAPEPLIPLILLTQSSPIVPKPMQESLSIETPLLHPLSPFCQTVPNLPLRKTGLMSLHVLSKAPHLLLHPPHLLLYASPPPQHPHAPPWHHGCCCQLLMLAAHAPFLPATTCHYNHTSCLLLHDIFHLARISEEPDVSCAYFVRRKPSEKARNKNTGIRRSYICAARSKYSTTSANRL